MGLHLGFSSDFRKRPFCSSSYNPSYGYIKGNPVITNFVVTQLEKTKKHCVALVRYPDCTTFGGLKIMVYKLSDYNKIKKTHTLDPHFRQSGDFLPIARFPATKKGWEHAFIFCHAIEAD